MGRKIPAKKHRGVKDPIKQQERRFQELQAKINAPPTDPDDQPVPKSLTRLFEFKNKLETKPKSKINKNKNLSMTDRKPGLHQKKLKQDRSIANMRQLPGETKRDFMIRIKSAIHDITRDDVNQAEMHKSLNPDQYPEVNKKEERLENIRSLKQKRKEMKEKMNKKKKNDGDKEQPKLGRVQRWALKKKEKKLKRMEKGSDDESRFQPQYERIEFGETVHEPPSLHVKPRKARMDDGAPRPGRRDLLLTKILSGETTAAEKVTAPTFIPKTVANDKKMGIDKAGKRKNLPIGVRMRLEQSQQEAIKAYRAMKNNKIKNINKK